MRIDFFFLCVTAVLALSVSLVGCGSDPQATPAASEADGNRAGHVHPSEGPHGGHAHDDEDHEGHEH